MNLSKVCNQRITIHKDKGPNENGKDLPPQHNTDVVVSRLPFSLEAPLPIPQTPFPNAPPRLRSPMSPTLSPK